MKNNRRFVSPMLVVLFGILAGGVVSAATTYNPPGWETCWNLCAGTSNSGSCMTGCLATYSYGDDPRCDSRTGANCQSCCTTACSGTPSNSTCMDMCTGLCNVIPPEEPEN